MAEEQRVTRRPLRSLLLRQEGLAKRVFAPPAADAQRIAAARIEELVIEHQTRLARYLRRMVGDAEAAVDLAQDTFFAAYKMLKSDAERTVTAGWLYKTATNLAISYLRRQKLIRWLPIDGERQAIDLRSDERSAASVDLQAALARLAPDQAACVMLTNYVGYTSFEAAEILGISPDAVRQRVCRAMKTLRGVMRSGS